MRKFFILVIVFFIVICFVVGFFLQFDSKENIMGDKEVLSEINRLLLPVSDKSLTVKDLSLLKNLVKSNEIATDEVHEIEVLALKKEYSHVGHGLGNLYRYIQTGLKRECPGHNFAHFYVFSSHGEKELAIENLMEAREDVFGKKVHELFTQTLARIDSGNLSASEDELSELADAECL